MARYLCIHGHFYQPPRENPWLEKIEFQDSAAPYHDWNERITAECYSPNSHARIIDREGWIARIENNYEWISFNFGPTLLSWMEEHAPDVYGALQRADQRSMEHFGGHGSAIAQVYNHMIMPLASPRDKITQVRWGIEDFQHRFGRMPEGMWLAETAVDTPTLEVLADHGIEYTILAPHQAVGVREMGADAWTTLEGAGIDTTRAYRCPLPSGRSIDLFFYNGPISQAVAFEGLLQRGEFLVDRMMSAFENHNDDPQLVHFATDGETFGHHHRFGEMALAWALEVIERDEGVQVTNYGQFRELHPPRHEVQLNERTAWSCAHGVGRWERDCGCHTGGPDHWNQQWRAPLRESLDWLRAVIEPVFEEAMGPLVEGPWEARNGYISVVLNRSPETLKAYEQQWAHKPLAPEEESRLLKALEMQRNAMLMYTSCGWFFDDLSGIETVQVLCYACRVLQLANQLGAEDLEEEFLKRLEAGRSNLPQMGGGRRIWERLVRPQRVNLDKVAAHYGVTSLFREYPKVSQMHSFTVERLEGETMEAGQAKLAVGRVRVTANVVHESDAHVYAVLYFGGHNLTGGVRPYVEEAEYQHLARTLESAFQRADLPEVISQLEQQFEASTYSLRSLFRDEQRWILEKLLEQTVEETETVYRKLYKKHQPLVRFFDHYEMPIPGAFAAIAEFALTSMLRSALRAEEADLDQIEEALGNAHDEHVKLAEANLEYDVRRCLEGLMGQFKEKPESRERLERCIRMMDLVKQFPFHTDLSYTQNLFYELMRGAYRDRMAEARNGDEELTQWVERFEHLGGQLRLRMLSPQARETTV